MEIREGRIARAITEFLASRQLRGR